MSVARPPSRRTRRSPPGKCTSTSPSPCVAAATATALEPDAVVSPTPRSQTRAVTSPGASTRATWTFVRFGKRGMRLEQRPDPREVVGIADDDRVRVADRHADDVEIRDALRLGDFDVTELRLVQLADTPHLDDARPDAHVRDVMTGALHEPRAGDARPVARHLGVRSVRIHDRNGHVVAIDRQDVDRSVEAVLVHVRLTLEDEVHVPVCVPARRCHRRSRPAGDPRRP